MLSQLHPKLRNVGAIFTRSLKALLAGSILLSLSGCHHYGMLSPRGIITHDERTLFFDALALMLIVVVPVIIMSFAFAFRYRQSHPDKSDYRPEWSHNNLLEAIWWAIPMVIIVILGVLTWKKTHSLDPYRNLDVPGKPLTIEAVALRWKWLFIYPDQNIASVNYVAIPADRPVQFMITADAPMSAFFIPRLGSQIYAMAGMRTRLNLYSTMPGTYEGLNTQYNGAGFSDMHFKAHVVAKKDFNVWVKQQQTGSHPMLDIAAYKTLEKPTTANPAAFYTGVTPDLFNKIMNIYMADKPLR